jgi:hypothetical protein
MQRHAAQAAEPKIATTPERKLAMNATQSKRLNVAEENRRTHNRQSASDLITPSKGFMQVLDRFVWLALAGMV